jgi:hypothetical protein
MLVKIVKMEKADDDLRGVSRFVDESKVWQGVACYIKRQGLGSHQRRASVIRTLGGRADVGGSYLDLMTISTFPGFYCSC